MIIRSNEKRSIIPPIIMIVFAVFFCIMWQSGLQSSEKIREKYLPEDATYVEATLLEMRTNGKGVDREYEFDLEYIVNGETYTTTYSGWKSDVDVKEDDIFRVMIRPEHPEKVVGFSHSSGVLAGRGTDRQKFILKMGNSMGYMGYVMCGIVVLLGIRVLVKTMKYNKELEKKNNE